MGYDKYLGIGDRITLLYDEEVYNSKIVKFHKRANGIENIIILLPSRNSMCLKVYQEKKKGEIIFYAKSGIYKGECKILDKYKVDSVVEVVEIAIVSELEKYQRREYFRIDYIDSIKFRVVAYKDEETGAICAKDDVWHFGTMTNISGGGLRFNSADGMENARKVEVKFKLKDNSSQNSKVINEEDEDKEYIIEADVVGVRIRSNTDKKYDYRIQFENIDKNDLESIVKFVFERDRWMRKKSIGKN